jgi:membrane protein
MATAGIPTVESAEQRLRAMKAEVAGHVQGIKGQAMKVARSPYVVGGAIASLGVALGAGYVAFKRNPSKFSWASLRPNATSLKWGQRLLPLVTAGGAVKAAKPDPRSFPVVVETPESKAAAKAAANLKKGFFAKQWFLIKEAFKAWSDDYAASMGAALSYYTLFSIAPLLIIVIAVAGMIFGQEAAQGEILGQLRGIMGEEGAVAIEGMLKAARHTGKSVVATIIGVFMLLLGATAVFGELQSALDRIWQTPAPKKESGILHMLRTRVMSFGLVLGLGFLLMVSLVVSAGLSAVGKWYGGWFEGWEVLLQAINFIVSFGIFTVLFAMIYKLMPRAKISWHDVWTGAAATSLLFSVGKVLIGLYLGKSSMASGFGAAGSLVVLLAWVYYSAQIFLLGAEYTWVYAKEYGSCAHKPEPPPAPVLPQKPD